MIGSNYRALAAWADLLYSVDDLYILLPELVSALAVALLWGITQLWKWGRTTSAFFM